MATNNTNTAPAPAITDLHRLPTELVECVAKHMKDRTLFAFRATSSKYNKATSRVFASRIFDTIYIKGMRAPMHRATEMLQLPHAKQAVRTLDLRTPRPDIERQGGYATRSRIDMPSTDDAVALLEMMPDLRCLQVVDGGEEPEPATLKLPGFAPVTLRALAHTTMPKLDNLTIVGFTRISTTKFMSVLFAHRHTLKVLVLLDIKVKGGNCLGLVRMIKENMTLKRLSLGNLRSSLSSERPFELGSADPLPGYAPDQDVHLDTGKEYTSLDDRDWYDIGPEYASMHGRGELLMASRLSWIGGETHSLVDLHQSYLFAGLNDPPSNMDVSLYACGCDILVHSKLGKRHRVYTTGLPEH